MRFSVTRNGSGSLGFALDQSREKIFSDIAQSVCSSRLASIWAGIAIDLHHRDKFIFPASRWVTTATDGPWRTVTGPNMIWSDNSAGAVTTLFSATFQLGLGVEVWDSEQSGCSCVGFWGMGQGVVEVLGCWSTLIP